jgi:sulfatase modifying factor 1
MNVDTAKLRQFINDHFGPQDLNDLLFDYFRSVHEDLTPGMTKQQQISLLLEFCYRHNQMENLLVAVGKMRPFFQPTDYVPGEKAPTTASQPIASITRNPRQIFISHAHQDAEVAQRLAHDLEAHGYNIWIAPDSIRPGEKWVEAISRGLEESGIFVLLLSPDAVASRWVQLETNVAITYTHEDEMQLYPLMLKACQLPALWRAFQHISLRGGYERGFEQLLAALEPVTSKQDFSVNPALRELITVEAASPKATPKEPARAELNSFIHEKSGKTFVRVPAGEFLYGDDKKKMYLDEFWMAKTPVTNAEYARFVAATKAKPPKHWQGSSPPAELANHPVVYVSWHDAKAYAEWAGMALPTEQQWEKAARGTDGHTYPWGNEWRENHCNTWETGIRATTPVGKFSPQGNSVYGCVDMAGNVWEWTNNWWDEKQSFCILCGGSWLIQLQLANLTFRHGYDPTGSSNLVGFRVVSPVVSGS